LLTHQIAGLRSRVVPLGDNNIADFEGAVGDDLGVGRRREERAAEIPNASIPLVSPIGLMVTTSSAMIDAARSTSLFVMPW
jgi:hypothetical protein